MPTRRTNKSKTSRNLAHNMTEDDWEHLQTVKEVQIYLKKFLDMDASQKVASGILNFFISIREEKAGRAGDVAAGELVTGEGGVAGEAVQGEALASEVVAEDEGR